MVNFKLWWRLLVRWEQTDSHCSLCVNLYWTGHHLVLIFWVVPWSWVIKTRDEEMTITYCDSPPYWQLALGWCSIYPQNIRGSTFSSGWRVLIVTHNFHVLCKLTQGIDEPKLIELMKELDNLKAYYVTKFYSIHYGNNNFSMLLFWKAWRWNNWQWEASKQILQALKL